MAPSRSLWIGNIESSLNAEDLYSIFSQFGIIESIRMLPEKECAFVNFAKTEEALLARERMQGGRIGNCIVRIGFGKPESIQETPAMQPTKSLWVGNVAPSTKPSDLEYLFSRYGKVESARVLVYMSYQTHKKLWICEFCEFGRSDLGQK
jgi:protein JSN1